MWHFARYLLRWLAFRYHLQLFVTTEHFVFRKHEHTCSDFNSDDSNSFRSGDRLSADSVFGSSPSMLRRHKVGAIGQYGGESPERSPGAIDAVKRRAFTRSFSGLLKGSSEAGKAIMKGVSLRPLL
jgi:hypothetical protein